MCKSLISRIRMLDDGLSAIRHTHMVSGHDQKSRKRSTHSGLCACVPCRTRTETARGARPSTTPWRYHACPDRDAAQLAPSSPEPDIHACSPSHCYDTNVDVVVRASTEPPASNLATGQDTWTRKSSSTAHDRHGRSSRRRAMRRPMEPPPNATLAFHLGLHACIRLRARWCLRDRASRATLVSLRECQGAYELGS